MATPTPTAPPPPPPPRACRLRPLVDERERAAARADARRLAAELASPLGERAPLDPVRAFVALFGALPDESSIAAVRRAYVAAASSSSVRRRARYARDAPGFVYVFRDAADAPHTYKIGRSRSAPEARLAEWRAELGLAGATRRVVLLFAYATRRATLAERVVHALLVCWRLAPRVNPATHRTLTEYFRVERLDALKVFIDAATRHVSWFDGERRA